MNVDIIWHLQIANSKQKPGLIGDIYFKVSVSYAIIKNTSHNSNSSSTPSHTDKFDTTFLGESNVASDKTSSTEPTDQTDVGI